MDDGDVGRSNVGAPAGMQGRTEEGDGCSAASATGTCAHSSTNERLCGAAAGSGGRLPPVAGIAVQDAAEAAASGRGGGAEGERRRDFLRGHAAPTLPEGVGTCRVGVTTGAVVPLPVQAL